MNFAVADQIGRAVLYEGYILYPYRPSSIKNQQRWTFGGVYPAGCAASGAARMEAQCLVEGDAATRVEARVRFLQPLARQIGEMSPPLDCWPAAGEPATRPVTSLECGGRSFYTWEESMERELRLPIASLAELRDKVVPFRFEFAPTQEIEPIMNAAGQICGTVRREQAGIACEVTLSSSEVHASAWRLIVRIDNTTPMPASKVVEMDAAQKRAFMSTHVILGVEGGAFVSLIDPPEHFASAAKTCTNQSAWPVLVGEEGRRDTLLCSPIILYDYPEIAAESPGDLFDGTEIDEILTLRILTMTDAEKAEMTANDERAGALLARTESLTPAQLEQLHGVMRSPDGPASIAARAGGDAPLPRLAALNDGALALRIGARVRLRPRPGGDVFDLALAGQKAIVEAIEVDFDNRVHVAVTVDDDPGQDLGMERLPGHRFFFSPDEIECLSAAEAAS